MCGFVLATLRLSICVYLSELPVYKNNEKIKIAYEDDNDDYANNKH